MVRNNLYHCSSTTTVLSKRATRVWSLGVGYSFVKGARSFSSEVFARGTSDWGNPLKAGLSTAVDPVEVTV